MFKYSLTHPVRSPHVNRNVEVEDVNTLFWQIS